MPPCHDDTPTNLEDDHDSKPLAGTRIIYDRNTLMHYRKSPLSKTPPADFPSIPGVTAPGVQESIAEGDEDAESPVHASPPKAAKGPAEEDELFDMDQ